MGGVPMMPPSVHAAKYVGEYSSILPRGALDADWVVVDMMWTSPRFQLTGSNAWERDEFGEG